MNELQDDVANFTFFMAHLAAPHNGQGTAAAAAFGALTAAQKSELLAFLATL